MRYSCVSHCSSYYNIVTCTAKFDSAIVISINLLIYLFDVNFDYYVVINMIAIASTGRSESEERRAKIAEWNKRRDAANNNNQTTNTSSNVSNNQ